MEEGKNTNLQPEKVQNSDISNNIPNENDRSLIKQVC